MKPDRNHKRVLVACALVVLALYAITIVVIIAAPGIQRAMQ